MSYLSDFQFEKLFRPVETLDSFLGFEEQHDAGAAPLRQQLDDGRGKGLGQVHPARQHHRSERGLRLLLLLLL